MPPASSDLPARNGTLPWTLAVLAVLLLAAAVRLPALATKPLHHDEGVNGFFQTQLYRHAQYRYNPHNYHGPTLYFAALPATLLLGLDDVGLRMVTVVFGLAAVWLATRLQAWIGRVGALSAALLLAVSPGMVYYSRYFIHEILLVAASLGLVVAGHQLALTADRAALLWGAFWAAWLVGTKETAVATLIVLGLAPVCHAVWCRWRGVRARLWAQWPSRTGIALSLLVFSAVTLLLYTSFFTHPRGILDAVRALRFWGKTGVTAHVHPWWAYLSWLWRAEPSILVLGVVGVVVILWRRRWAARSALAFWALGMLAAYSLVPYKTPWLTLNVVLPLAVCAGVAVEEMRRRWGSWLAVPVLTLAASLALGQAVDLSFRRYDDEALPYVYAHTRRVFLDLVRQIEKRSAATGGPRAKITVTAREHWPLPWYLRRYSATSFTADMKAANAATLVVGGRDQDAELRRVLGPRYERVGEYPLRPGVTLVLYARGSRDRP